MVTIIDPRRRMVRRQIAGRGVCDRRVLLAMEKVPREAFLPAAMREFAYEDTPLPIEEGQTISQPYIVARMAEAADIGAGDRVLEIGAGSGYAAAVLGELAGRVFTIERHATLAGLARARLRQLGYDNVEVRTGDGTLGWPEQAPFDAIIATASGPRVPDSWRAQLAVEGRLVLPVGATPTHQRLIRLTRTGPETWHEEELEEVRFVPLIGEQGWPEEHETFRTSLETELQSHYAEVDLPGQFGAHVWFDRTTAVHAAAYRATPGDLSVRALTATQEDTMKVSEIMTRDVCIARPDHTIEDVARMMLAIDAGLLPVGDDDRLLGTITDRDIAVRAIAEGKGPKTLVSEVMSEDVKYCFEDEDSAHVAQNMGELQVRRLPVLNRDKRLVGILSLADLAQAERGQRVGNALRQIAQPGGEHTQGANQRSGGM